MEIKPRVATLFFLALLSAQTAQAYIDPGTGGMVLGSIGPIILAILAAIGGFLLKHFIKPIKKAVLRLWALAKRVFRSRMAKFILVIIVVAIAVYLILSTAFYPNINAYKMNKKKVVIIGIDAFDPKVMDKLMGEGRLPNFKRLGETGSYSRLETTMPPETPVAWSAAATGSNPGKYGLYDFISRNPETYTPQLNLAHEKQGPFGTQYESSLKGVPFWRITSDAGISTTVIRWPVTFPPEKVKGRMLSGLGVVDIKGFLNSYRFYTTESISPESEGSDKVVKVSKEGNMIRTKLSGPVVRKGSDLVDVEVPMDIEVNKDSATITIDNAKYPVKTKGWSGWIRVKFKAGFMRDVYGVFKVYLLSTEPDFNMYATSVQIDPENPVVDMSYPKDYAKELAGKIGLFYTLGMPEDTKAVTEGRIGKQVFLEQINQIEEEREKMFWHEFGRFNEGVLAFGFDSSDRLQHMFWTNKVLSNASPDFSVPQEIEDYYVKKDSFLGKVMDRVDNDTVLIIFSDHGFNSFERAVSINTWLVENGYMVIAQEPDESHSGELFEYVDWSKTKAYSLGFTSLYINMRGREGEGIVGEKDKEALVSEIINKLENLTDKKTGKKAIAHAYAAKDIYKGEYMESSPDIVIGFEQGYRMSWQNAVGGLAPEVFMDNKEEWAGDHLIDRQYVPGILFTNFKVSKENPALADLAPTVLSFLGIKPPEAMDGENLNG